MQVFPPSSNNAKYRLSMILYVYSFCPRWFQSSCSFSAYTKSLLFVILETRHAVCSERNESASVTDVWSCPCLLPSCHQREARFHEVLVSPQAIGCTVTLRQWMECSVKSSFSPCENIPVRALYEVKNALNSKRCKVLNKLQTCLQQTHDIMLVNANYYANWQIDTGSLNYLGSVLRKLWVRIQNEWSFSNCKSDYTVGVMLHILS